MLPCFLSEDEWINLDHVRSFQYEDDPLLVVVTWADGKRTTYRDQKAVFLLTTWLQIINSNTTTTPDELG
ncbi:hypothetical protein [Synechocystis sp. PCC 7509]|uniref:hypothetical protein n=1 Tax=Synechocystis sp. PCC 7509 TaxID=927677 RepID=UPI0002AC5DB1|nr:hypothetical protein [Synechocystis sp. PCC 7509]